MGFLVGDCNICDPAQGRLHSRTQTSTDGDTDLATALLAAFPCAVEIAKPYLTRKDMRR